MLLSTRPQLLELPTPNASRASLASKTEAELWPPYHLPSLARGRAGQKKERKLAKFTGSGSEPEKHLGWRNMPALAPIILRQPGFGLGSPAFEDPATRQRGKHGIFLNQWTGLDERFQAHFPSGNRPILMSHISTVAVAHRGASD